MDDSRTDPRLHLDIDGAIATITNDNPDKHNAFDDDMDLALFERALRDRVASPERARPSSGEVRAARGRRAVTWQPSAPMCRSSPTTS